LSIGRSDPRTDLNSHQVNAAKKAVKVISCNTRLILATVTKREDLSQELLNPADRDAERARGSNIGGN
jgi:hypothetical protein